LAVIIVHDHDSADTLRSVLRGELQGAWAMLVEDEPRAEIKPASRRAAAQVITRPAPQKDDDSADKTEHVPPAEPAPVSAPAGSSSRRHPRYKVRLHVVITVGVQTFNSPTRDVSLGGIALEEKLPPWTFGSYCRISIYKSTDAERIDLRCRIFADPRHPRRLQFIDPPEDGLARLKDWLEAMAKAGDANVA
jgi:hypothetical protein